ncbi:MAG TPA: NAD(P)H-hydrate dehydratase [Pyrinomonadaceae bacterium]|nr:NAD(P)H-hydrate dehydratase [Pyrinomonadaceae bacterium]
MQPVLTAAQMREVDRLTTEEYGIPSIILMENAANAVARVITEKLGGSVKMKEIFVLCGPGNNGGDGAALARMLADAEAAVAVVLLGTLERTKGDARTNFEKLVAMADQPNLEFFEAGDIAHASDLLNEREWGELSCVVDAVFGTGLRSPRDDVNELIASFPDVLHVAIDIQSGLMADRAEAEGTQFRPPDVTVTFTAPKPANVLPPASNFNGELVVANIGSPEALVRGQHSQLFLAENADAKAWLARTKFSSDSYKNTRGHSLVIAGSESYSGAAVLAGNAAMRSGVGLVTLITPRSSKDSVASRILPEVMIRGVEETEDGAIAEEAFDEIDGLLEKADSIAIGCGLSQSESTRNFVKRVVAGRRQPVVVDADALNLLSPVSKNWPPAHAGGTDPIPNWPPAHAGCTDKSALTNVRASSTLRAAHAGGSDVILTPHEGEFLRLLGESKNHPDAEASPLLRKEGSLAADRVAAVREFATTHNVILVLKGERVLIGAPDGRVVVNPTGNSGLGKAGNGDTLTGILAGFTAQAAAMKIDIFETVVAAVYVAGMAGDIAAANYGKRVMTASDVRECLVDAFAVLEN